jgi:MSHA biogenesis protein MshK
LPDPTRPATFATLAPDNAAGAGSAQSPEQLQSVLIGRSGRRVAVINGQTLRLGDKFCGATLVGISENSVSLKKGRKRHVLKLFPAPLERRPSAVSCAKQ